MQDYISVVRRRWWLLLCPLVALAAVVYVTVNRPPSFTSTATVSALAVSGGPTGQYSGTSGAKTFVANFQAALRSPAVIAQVVLNTGVTTANARNGLSSAPVGESTIIEVTYRTPVRAQAEPVATEAAKRTMAFLFASQVTLASEPLATAQAALAAADEELAAFTATASTPVPDRDYQILADQISSLQTLQAEAAARQEISIAARYGGEIAAKQGQLTQLATTLKKYNELTANRSLAADNLTASRQNLDQARAQFAAGDPDRIVAPAEAVKVSQLGPAAKGGVTAFVSGLFFAAGIALLLELRRSQKLAAAADARADAIDPPRADPPPTAPSAAEPAPTSPSVTEPVLTAPEPTEPSATEPVAEDSEPTGPSATEPVAEDSEPTGPSATEPVAEDSEPTEASAAEPAPAEASGKAVDPGPTEPARGDCLPQDA